MIEALNAVVAKHPRWGFWKCHDRLRLDGHAWNHKHVHRVYRSLRLNLPRRTRCRLPTRPTQPLAVRPIPNEVWSLDFMSDALYQGRRFRTLNVIDDGMREGLAIEVDTNLPAARVVRVLERLVSLRGTPKALRSDNGPEFLAEVYTDWRQAKGIEIRYIQPGKPDQNAYVERFNRSYRQEVLDAYLFASLDEVRSISEQWLTVYNEQRHRRTDHRRERLADTVPRSTQDWRRVDRVEAGGARGEVELPKPDGPERLVLGSRVAEAEARTGK